MNPVSLIASIEKSYAMGRMNGLFRNVVVAAFVFSAASVAAQSPSGSVAGAVSVPGADRQPFAVPGVSVTLTCPGREPRVAVSNETGEFRFDAAATGDCSIVAELQGFASAATAVAVHDGQEAVVALQLGLDTLKEDIMVTARADAGAESPIAAHVERLTNGVMQTAPIASERFQDALPLIPGVVRGPDGLLNINGARSNQSALMFNSANATDPVTGEDAIELPIDAVSAVQVRGAAFAPEFGLSAGAMTSVETRRGGAAWHATVNDLEPRVRRRAGEFRGVESWTPRATAGGPLAPSLALLESIQYEYSQTRVFDLPPFQSDTKLESFESYTRLDWTASSSSRLTGSLIASPRKTTYAGLNPFNPQSVTPNIRGHNVLASANDQTILGGTGVLESLVSVKELDSTIYPSQGNGPMVLTPDVNSGSYFNDQSRTSWRAQWLTTYAFTPFGPSHLVKVGGGVTYETFDGVSTSRPVDIVAENGEPLERIAFAGTGHLGRSRSGVQGYGQDSWTISPRATAQFGARYDYDSFTGDVNVAPRGSLTVLLTADGRTIARGGAGAFYDPLPLNVASFDQQQQRSTTLFDANGLSVAPPALMRNVVGSPLHTPRSVNWNAEIDREWIKNFFLRLSYQQRRTRFEPILDPTADAAGDPVLALRTEGESRYREAQVTGRFQFHGTDQIVGSYTRSSAVGNLNDFNTYFGNLENPVIRPDARGPLPWDAPNRFLVWTTLGLPHGFTVFPLLDVRTGFPLSDVDAYRHFVGARNEAGRYPTFASLDLQVSKRLRLFAHNATIGLKVFNVTDRFNPRDYQGNTASASFGAFANSVGRAFRGKWVFEF
jgi:hypothetical protein